MMAMNLNDENIDERKLNTIKLRILEAETDNIEIGRASCRERV